MVTLRKIYSALESLGILAGDKESALEQIASAIDALKEALISLDTLQVTTRANVDTLLGCMMAIDAIIGEDNNG